jgi:hypothetical protein
MSSPQFSEVQLTAAYDQLRMRTAENIRTKGVSIVAVGDNVPCDSCPPPSRAQRRALARQADGSMFAYTIGLFGLAHPELLLFPDSVDLAFYVLNTVAARVVGGQRIISGQVVALHEIGRHAIAAEVPNPGQIAFRANDYYQRPPEYSVPLLQLTLTDAEGRLPSDPGYDYRPQPEPGEFTA